MTAQGPQRRNAVLYTITALVALIGAVWWLAERNRSQPSDATAQPAPAAAPVRALASIPGADLTDPAGNLAEPTVPVTSSPAPGTADATAASTASVSKPVMPAEKENHPPAIAGAQEALAGEEVAATRRMYVAHAPLREPEVADPDSEANRRTLQTMVEKALGRAAAEGQPARTSN